MTISESYFSQHQAAWLEELKEFLSIPSISADSSHQEDCLRAARWVASQLQRAGFSTELYPTSGKPLVLGERNGDPSLPTILFYGHYDVQPVDPLDLWETPPFEPQLRGERMYARGAQDNKGQVFYVLKALQALAENNSLRNPFKVIIEGEEEMGSEGIGEALPQLKDRLKADVLLVCDTGVLSLDYPAITMGLRGIIHMEAELRGPKKDLHSGVHGGLVKNPVTELAKILASCFNNDGSIAIEGFYDGVRMPEPSDLELAGKLPFRDEEYLQEVGVLPRGGEEQFSPLVRRGFRPTFEVNGLYGGYQGEGSKTIIPSKATIKITSRLVGGQDPKRCLDLIERHVREKVSPEMTLEFKYAHVGGSAFTLQVSDPVIQRARKVLDELSGGKCTFIWEGASIPIIPALSETSGAVPLLVGFGLEEDNIHAPNESFSIAQLRTGFTFVTKFLTSY